MPLRSDPFRRLRATLWTARLPRDRQKQVEHFNRLLSQVTADWRCPELYYLRKGEYVPNPHVPLQWTQANLLVALHEMKATLARGARLARMVRDLGREDIRCRSVGHAVLLDPVPSGSLSANALPRGVAGTGN